MARTHLTQTSRCTCFVTRTYHRKNCDTSCQPGDLDRKGDGGTKTMRRDEERRGSYHCNPSCLGPQALAYSPANTLRDVRDESFTVAKGLWSSRQRNPLSDDESESC